MTSLGVAGNFRFVLRETKGDYFMWAADDDEWMPTFIERCFNALQSGAASAMSGFETSYRSSGKRRSAVLPELNPMRPVASNMRAFLHCLTPSLFYGLHRRSAIEFSWKKMFLIITIAISFCDYWQMGGSLWCQRSFM